MNQSVFFVVAVCAVFGVAIAVLIVGAISDGRREREMERKCNRHSLFLYVTRLAKALSKQSDELTELRLKVETLEEFVFKHRSVILIEKDGMATMRKFVDRPTLEECRLMGFDAAVKAAHREDSKTEVAK